MFDDAVMLLAAPTEAPKKDPRGEFLLRGREGDPGREDFCFPLKYEVMPIDRSVVVPFDPNLKSCSREYLGMGETCIFLFKFKSVLVIISLKALIFAIGNVGDVACLKDGA
jgi:hypothetical protein